MTEEWPAWANEPVGLAEPDPDWRVRAARLCEDVGARLADHLDGDVEHVGSTAVPDLPAKPIVDLIAPVRSLPEVEGALPELVAAGWSFVPPEIDGRPWRCFYVLAEGAVRCAHLQLVERTHPRWREMIAFRDALCARPDLVRTYAELKRDLARQHRTDREAYTAAKGAFVAQVLRSNVGS